MNTITIPRIQYLFNRYNTEHFSNMLPIPYFEIVHSKKHLGEFCCIYDYDTNESFGYTIKISDYYDLSNEQLRDVVIHEMIHFYLLITRMDENCTHGEEFTKMKDEFNDKYGYRILTLTPTDELKDGNHSFFYKLKKFFS